MSDVVPVNEPEIWYDAFGNAVEIYHQDGYELQVGPDGDAAIFAPDGEIYYGHIP